MPNAKMGDTVKAHYTGKLDDGSVFDSSRGREPLQFTVGQEQVIPGFENAVIGMSPGESKTAKIPPAEGYGPRHEENVIEVERQRLPDSLKPKVGMKLQIPTGKGEKIPVTVTAASESTVTLDANHPLAGKDLTFDIQLLEIV